MLRRIRMDRVQSLKFYEIRACDGLHRIAHARGPLRLSLATAEDLISRIYIRAEEMITVSPVDFF